jgi:hypothetical protein
MLAAVAAGLAAAASRAQQAAWAEERDMQRLMVMVADAQLRKVAAKTKLLAEMTQVGGGGVRGSWWGCKFSWSCRREGESVGLFGCVRQKGIGIINLMFSSFSGCIGSCAC